MRRALPGFDRNLRFLLFTIKKTSKFYIPPVLRGKTKPGRKSFVPCRSLRQSPKSPLIVFQKFAQGFLFAGCGSDVVYAQANHQEHRGNADYR